jgi:hypothetical protein
VGWAVSYGVVCRIEDAMRHGMFSHSGDGLTHVASQM